MNDMYKLLFFTPTVQKPIGEVLDKDLKNIQNFLDGINILTLKMAQLKYNERVKSNETLWWDNLEVYLGLPVHVISEIDLTDAPNIVPFGLLYDLFTISSSSQQIAIMHNWNVYDEDQFFHTDVDTFSTQCLADEWNIREAEGIFENYSKKEWGMDLEDLSDQIINHPHENLVKKKTLAIIDLINFKQDCEGYFALKTIIEVFKLLKEDAIKFIEIEGFVSFDREIVTSVGGYTNEKKPVCDFDLKDFYDFGQQIIDFEIVFVSFDDFLTYTQSKISEDITETFTETDQTILKDLYEKYLIKTKDGD